MITTFVPIRVRLNTLSITGGNGRRGLASAASGTLLSTKSFTGPKHVGGPPRWLWMVPVVTLGLGSWQLYRLQWKLQLIDSAKARMTGEPIPLEEATKIADHAIHEFQAVKAHGRFRHDMEIHLGLRSRGPAGDQRGGGLLSSQQSAGYFIFTPLETPSGRILVNRGWVPREQKDPRTRSGAQVQNDVDVVGAWRTGENPRSFPTNDPERNQWYSIDLEMMAASTGSLPVLLDLLAGPEANNSITELPGAPLARVSKVNLTNNHMSYSITWFGLSLLSGIWLAQRRRAPPLSRLRRI